MNTQHDVVGEVAGAWVDPPKTGTYHLFSTRQLVFAAVVFLAMFVLVAVCAHDSSVNYTRGDAYRQQRDVAVLQVDRLRRMCQAAPDGHAECGVGAFATSSSTTIERTSR